MSLQKIPGTCTRNIFSCVCKCCDFVPATCPRYTSLLRVASVLTTQVFCPMSHVAATCPCNMTPRVCPPLLLQCANCEIPMIVAILCDYSLFYTQKRNKAQLTRLKRQVQEALSRNRRWNDEACRLEQSIAQLKSQIQE